MRLGSVDFQPRRHDSRHGSVPAGTNSVLAVFPPELWLQIFPFLNDKDLRAVTRTCSAFRLLAQPLLFRVLDICPFFLAYNTEKPIHRPQQYLHTTLERLETYKLPRIAPAVTHLWISPYARNGFPPRRPTDDLDPTLVISVVMDALPNFPNIRSLTWHCIDFRPSWWAAVLRQSSLTRLWVNSCSIPHTLNPVPSHLPLRISHLDLDQWAWDGHITDHVSIHEERLKGVDPMLLSMTLNTESIRSVSVPRQDTALRLLSIIKNLSSDVPHTLTSLTVPYSSTISEDFGPALTGLPSLKELHILSPQEVRIHNPDLGDKLPPSSIPLLQTYEGPYHLLSLFSNTRHSEPRRLRFVDLWGLDDPIALTTCNPHRLEVVLEELTLFDVTLRALETISILISHVTIGLMVILSRFPNLKAAFLESQDSLIPNRNSPLQSSFELLPESSISVLYALLRSHACSPSLQHLAITTHLKNSSSPDSTAQHIDAARFLENLGQANPRLETIDLRYGTYWTGIVDINWQRRVIPNLDLDTTNVKGALMGDSLIIPPVSRTNTVSSLSSIHSDSSQAAVERFFALPSKPKSTRAIPLPLGDMTFSEQRRAGVLPEETIPFRDTKADIPGLGWIFGGVNKLRYLVGSVRRILVGGDATFHH